MAEFVSSNRRIAKNTALLYMRMAVSMLLSLFTSRVVLSTLGDDNFGIYNIVAGCVTLFTFLNGAISASASRHLTYELGRDNFTQLRKTFSSSFVVHCLAALVVIILSETVGLWLLDDKLIIPADRMPAAHWAYQISIVVVSINIIQVPFSALVFAHEKFNVYAYVSIADIVARLALIICLKVIPGDKLILWSVLGMTTTLLYVLFYVLYCRKLFPESKLLFHKEFRIYKNLLSYSSWSLIGTVSGMLQNQGMNIVLNLFYGPVVIAAKAISYQVQGMLSQFSGNFMGAAKPQIVKLYASGKIDEMMSLVIFSASLAFYLTWIFTLPICLELPYVLKLWLGNYPEYAVDFTIFTLILGVIYSIKISRTAATAATGRLRATTLTTCIVLCLTFPIGYVLLKMDFAPYTTIVVSIIATIIGEYLAVLVLRRYIVFSVLGYFLAVYGRSFLIAVVSIILPLVIHINMNEGFARLIFVSMSSVITVSLAMYILGLDKVKRMLLHEYIKNFMSRILNIMNKNQFRSH